MNPEIKSRWCDALRKAKVITPAAEPGGVDRITDMWYMASVRNEAQFSPEGLLIDLFMKDHNLEWEKIGGKWCALGRSCAMPDDVCNWAGLKTVCNKIKPAEYDENHNKISHEQKYTMEICDYDPILPSYKEYGFFIGRFTIPTLSIIMNMSRVSGSKETISYAQLADLIEKDL